MKNLRPLAIAAVAACTLLAAAPAISAQQSPATIMSRTVCFDEIKAFEVAHAKAGKTARDTAGVVDDVLKSFVPAGDDRTHALTNTEAIKATAAGPDAAPTDRDQLAVVLCAATVGAAADAGMRDLDAFRRHWASERARFRLPEPADSSAAAPPAPAPAPAIHDPHLERAARTTCAAEIKKFEAAHVQSGGSQPEAAAAIEDILRSFTGDVEPRARVVNSFDEMARAARDPRDVARLSLHACASTVGTLWSIGTRATGDFQSYWNGRGSARFAIGGATKANATGCVWMEWDEVRAGSPGTLRNICPFTVDMRFCMADPPAGSASESIACGKGLSRFERLEPSGSVRATLTEGARLNWVQCKAPLQPVQTSVPGAPFTAACK